MLPFRALNAPCLGTKEAVAIGRVVGRGGKGQGDVTDSVSFEPGLGGESATGPTERGNSGHNSHKMGLLYPWNDCSTEWHAMAGDVQY